MADESRPKLSYENLTGTQKAAILMISIGADASSNIFKNLSPDESENLAREIVGVQNVTSESIEKVIDEFYQLMMARDYLAMGGMNYAQEVLEKALAKRKRWN